MLALLILQFSKSITGKFQAFFSLLFAKFGSNLIILQTLIY